MVTSEALTKNLLLNSGSIILHSHTASDRYHLLLFSETEGTICCHRSEQRLDMVEHALNLSTQETEAGSEFEASLVYTESFRTAKAKQ